MTKAQKLTIELLRSAIKGMEMNPEFVSSLTEDDWKTAYSTVIKHGIAALTFPPIEKLTKNTALPKNLLLNWCGQMLIQADSFSVRRKAIDELCSLWEDAGIVVTELKGNSIGKFYPNPELRYSCDFDCFLSDYETGNRLVENQGVKVNRDFYKNSAFTWKGVYVENHQFCTPVRGNGAMKRFERQLRKLIGTADFDALFLMEHMWAHFFEDALSLKQLTDWAVLRLNCWKDVDENLFEQAARDCGFWRFAQSINQIAELFLQPGNEMIFQDASTQRLWESILEIGGSVEMNRGWKTRFQLVANYFSNMWKYREFSNHSAIYTLLRTCIAFVFDRNPKI